MAATGSCSPIHQKSRKRQSVISCRYFSPTYGLGPRIMVKAEMLFALCGGVAGIIELLDFSPIMPSRTDDFQTELLSVVGCHGFGAACFFSCFGSWHAREE